MPFVSNFFDALLFFSSLAFVSLSSFNGWPTLSFLLVLPQQVRRFVLLFTFLHFRSQTKKKSRVTKKKTVTKKGVGIGNEFLRKQNKPKGKQWGCRKTNKSKESAVGGVAKCVALSGMPK